MNKWSVLVLGAALALCAAREPFKPTEQVLPFTVYYTSRYRGLCVGTLVARTVVITAAVCVINPRSRTYDRRPITVVTGTSYRHPRRGVRVPITHLIIPKMPADQKYRAYLLQKSPAVMMMNRRVPDILADVPLRALDLDWKGEEALTLQEECLMPGWHFFYTGDKIFPIHKFLLQRTERVQFLNVVKVNPWCDTIIIKLAKMLSNVGYYGSIEKTAMICVKDPDNTAQPCHGMYGSPLVCQGRAVGMMMAPDAQWYNCTGYSNVIHLFSGASIRPFMECVSRMFQAEFRVNWHDLKKMIYDEHVGYDYIPALYDRLVADASSSSGEL